jgi:hypothetical protein
VGVSIAELYSFSLSKTASIFKIEAYSMAPRNQRTHTRRQSTGVSAKHSDAMLEYLQQKAERNQFNPQRPHRPQPKPRTRSRAPQPNPDLQPTSQTRSRNSSPETRKLKLKQALLMMKCKKILGLYYALKTKFMTYPLPEDEKTQELLREALTELQAQIDKVSNKYEENILHPGKVVLDYTELQKYEDEYYAKYERDFYKLKTRTKPKPDEVYYNYKHPPRFSLSPNRIDEIMGIRPNRPRRNHKLQTYRSPPPQKFIKLPLHPTVKKMLEKYIEKLNVIKAKTRSKEDINSIKLFAEINNVIQDINKILLADADSIIRLADIKYIVNRVSYFTQNNAPKEQESLSLDDPATEAELQGLSLDDDRPATEADLLGISLDDSPPPTSSPPKGIRIGGTRKRKNKKVGSPPF